MKFSEAIPLLALLMCCFTTNAQDFQSYFDNTNFKKYQEANASLPKVERSDKRVVFMGNSITESWPYLRPEFFERYNYVGRGISGQTTPQMLLRFREDVIKLNPKVVVLLAGINDIAQNTGFTPIELIADNIKSMAELAKANDIEVIISSVLPAVDFPWRPGLAPAEKVLALNDLLKDYCRMKDIPYVDYHSAMKDENNGLKVPDYTSENDLVHPNKQGYEVMERLVQPAIEKLLNEQKLKLHSLFTDHMVLQQKDEVRIWGASNPYESITISASWGASVQIKSDASGQWSGRLKTEDAGGPYSINVSTNEENVFLKDIMLGEVWLASRSIEYGNALERLAPRDPIMKSEEEIQNANYPDIRMFTVQRAYSSEKESSVKGRWNVCSPQSAPLFSATAYFFARKLHEELKVPIGIVETSWGGTPAESWVSAEQLRQLKDFDNLLNQLEDPEVGETTTKWFSQWPSIELPTTTDQWHSIQLSDQKASDEKFDVSDWETMQLPGRIDERSDIDINGAFWFRKSFNAKSLTGQLKFEMGIVDDIDAVYINGNKIGGTAYDFGNGRSYPIPQELLNEEENLVAIRIIDTGGPGSINGYLRITDEQGTVEDLRGEWKSIVSAEIYQGKIYSYDTEQNSLSNRPDIFDINQNSATSLFNAMIHPVIGYGIKGAIWYQGESNVGRAKQYEKLFPLMINDWRSRWNSSFPFYYVQIAPFIYNIGGNDAEDVSQKLRDAQRKTLSVPNTGMVVTLDIGNINNIHPANKQDVGYRLAGLALANDYHQDVVASGPLLKKVEIQENKMIIHFDHVGSGLLAKDGQLEEFEIAGTDRRFYPANAQLVNDSIVVHAEQVLKPKFVRYSWRDESVATLFNKEGLPASSFSTED